MRALPALALPVLGACAPAAAPAPDRTSGATAAHEQPVARPPATDIALSHSNVLTNPSFETGRDPWWSFAGPERPYWADFTLATDRPHSGHRAARLDLSTESYNDTKRIYGVIQETAPASMPQRMSGWVRVEGWERGAEHQYLQVVLIVWGPTNIGGGSPNIQISWVLGGIEEPPFQISNRRFIFLGDEEPVEGQWIHFERDLHEDFRRQYGVVPEGFTKLRILYEVRFDNRPVSGSPAGKATVWYDDLYLGP